MSNLFNSVDYNEGDLLPPIVRLSYFEMVRGAAFAFGGGFLLSAVSGGAAVLSTLGMALYVIPLFLFFSHGIQLISALAHWVLFKFIPRTKNNRWTFSSIINVIVSSPIWILAPGLVVFIGVMVSFLPYGVVQILNGHTDSDSYNLLLQVYPHLIQTDVYMSAGEQFARFFLWDDHNIILSIFRIVVMWIMINMTYTAHPHITREQYLKSEYDTWLMYERYVDIF